MTSLFTMTPCEFGFEVTENGLEPQANLKKCRIDLIGLVDV